MAAADLVEYVAKSLVDDPEAVSVEVINGDEGTIIELHVAEADMGKVIGRNGQRRQGAPHPAQGDVRPHGRAGQPRDRLGIQS